MVAPPGAGKGTQAARLAEHFGIAHIASGDLLRSEVAAGTALGREAAAYLDRGDLVPDRVVLDMLVGRVAQAADAGGFILDGFPRTLAQAQAAYELAQPRDIALDAVIALEVPPEELWARMSARAAAEGRADDTQAVFEHRLAIYDEQTKPLLNFYDERGLLQKVDGARSVDEVFADIVGVLEDLSVS